MDCTCTVDEIAAFCGGINAPDLNRYIAITCEDQLASIPAAGSGTHVISTNITYASSPAGKFFKWNFSKSDSSYKSTRDENGLWNTEVKFFIPKMDATTSYTMNGLTGENLICIVPDRNDQKRLVGAIGNGCKVDVVETTTPKNGYEVTITWQSAHAPYFYTGTITY